MAGCELVRTLRDCRGRARLMAPSQLHIISVSVPRAGPALICSLADAYHKLDTAGAKQ
jgi:hypothetical protein